MATPADRSVMPETPRRHSRKTSLGFRPPNAGTEELGQLLDERDRTIDQLRAEIGEAKAEEAKAREIASDVKSDEERMRTELDRTSKGHKKAEQEWRRRESEVSRIMYLSSLAILL